MVALRRVLGFIWDEGLSNDSSLLSRAIRLDLRREADMKQLKGVARNRPAAAAIVFATLVVAATCAAKPASEAGPGLTTLSSDGAELKERFNATRGSVRFVVLLSPT